MMIETIRQRICDKVARISSNLVTATISGIVGRNDGSISAHVYTTDLETGRKTDLGRMVFNGVDD